MDHPAAAVGAIACDVVQRAWTLNVGSVGCTASLVAEVRVCADLDAVAVAEVVLVVLVLVLAVVTGVERVDCKDCNDGTGVCCGGIMRSAR